MKAELRVRALLRALEACSKRRVEMGRELVELQKVNARLMIHQLARKELVISVLVRERQEARYGHA